MKTTWILLGIVLLIGCASLSSKVNASTTCNPAQVYCVTTDGVVHAQNFKQLPSDTPVSIVGPTSVVASDYATGELAIAAANALSSAVLFLNNTSTISTNVAINSTVTLQCVGGKWSIASTKTLTINGTIFCPRYQIFDGSGNVSFSTNTKMLSYSAEWFGFKGDNSTDNVAPFNAMQTACTNTTLNRCVVTFSEGDYRFTTEITFSQIGLKLEGAGCDAVNNLAFGDANWLIPGYITGTVFRFINTTDGIDITGGAGGFAQLRGLCVVGPGSGTTKGIYLSGSNGRFIGNQVVVANFSIGWCVGCGGNPDDVQQAEFHNVKGYGCQTCLLLGKTTVSDAVNNTFYQFEANQCSSVCVDIENGVQNSFIGGYTEHAGIYDIRIQANGNANTFTGFYPGTGSLIGADSVYIAGSNNYLSGFRMGAGYIHIAGGNGNILIGNAVLSDGIDLTGAGYGNALLYNWANKATVALTTDNVEHGGFTYLTAPYTVAPTWQVVGPLNLMTNGVTNGLFQKDSGGTLRLLAGLNSSDVLQFGNGVSYLENLAPYYMNAGLRFLPTVGSTTPITMTGGETFIRCDSANLGGAFVVNLPAIGSITQGMFVTIIKDSAAAGTCTITPNGTDTINRTLSYELSIQDNTVTLVAGTNSAPKNWYIVSVGGSSPSFDAVNIKSGGSTTISTGVGSVKMSTANAATNTAWIPIQYNGTTYYVPAFTTNAP